MEFVLVRYRGKNSQLAGVQAAGDSVFTPLKGILNPRTKIERTQFGRMGKFLPMRFSFPRGPARGGPTLQAKRYQKF